MHDNDSQAVRTTPDDSPDFGDQLWHSHSIDAKAAFGTMVLAASLTFSIAWTAGLSLQAAVIPTVVVGFLSMMVLDHFPQLGNQTFFYEDGLVLRGPRHWREHAYDTLRSFSCEITDVYINGSYTSTGAAYRLEFETANGLTHVEMEGLKYNRNTLKARQADALRDRLSDVVAWRMMETLHRQGEVPWVLGAKILPEGLEVFPRNSHHPEVFPYAEIDGIEVENGRCRLTSHGRLVLDERTGSENFFPGIALVQWLAARSVDSTDAEQPALSADSV